MISAYAFGTCKLAYLCNYITDMVSYVAYMFAVLEIVFQGQLNEWYLYRPTYKMFADVTNGHTLCYICDSCMRVLILMTSFVSRSDWIRKVWINYHQILLIVHDTRRKNNKLNRLDPENYQLDIIIACGKSLHVNRIRRMVSCV